MMRGGEGGRFLFPKWVNQARPALAVLLIVVPIYLVVLIWLAGSPKTTAVGYTPDQPVPYSHTLHVGQLGLDCRYCHNTVENTAYAALPPTQTCMNCHARVRTASPRLAAVRESAATGMSIAWVKVHDLPDYVYFDHSVHVRRGVGCVECHGRIDTMAVVGQVKPLSMGWCLDCHRAPESHLRPPEKVTAMDWTPPADAVAFGLRLREALKINPSTDCWTCHR